MDQFKPKTIYVQQSPLQVLKEDIVEKSDSGLTIPALFESISNVKGDEFFELIKSTIVEASDVYKCDLKENFASKKMVDGSGLQVSDYASYALYHMKRNEKNIDRENIQIMFADLTPE